MIPTSKHNFLMELCQEIARLKSPYGRNRPEITDQVTALANLVFDALDELYDRITELEEKIETRG